ncbi:AAA family ATPase [Acinetobacter pittii]|uniref:AAA family ATPase n=1 Tax=Acinetobacter pittii TaxID=48296 RepID=UPI00301629D2
MIQLKKITFKNFKIFGNDPYTINLDHNNLILLDGPNGYGKTSVFDAIELSLTGNISRLISVENRQVPTDVVVAHKGNENVEITIELMDQNYQIKTFQRKLKNNPPKALKKISKFSELWELYEIIDGELIESSQNELDEYLGSQDLARDFLLFHYVQQEETSQFLKTKNEVKRAEELAQLFGNTLEADEKLNKLKDIQNKISTEKSKIETQINNINELYKINDLNLKSENSEQHLFLFPWLSEMHKTPFWDMPSIQDFSQEKFNNSLEEISHIKNLIKYQDFFIKNRSFESVTQQREQLKLYLGYYQFIDQYDFYVDKEKNYKFIKNVYNILNNNDYKSIQTISNLESVYELLGLKNYSSFQNSLQLLINQEAKNHGLSSIYNELLQYHNEMSSKLQHLPNESSCLLCGHDHQTHDALANAIAQHKLVIELELTDKEKLLSELREEFNNFHLLPLIHACKVFLEKNIVISNEELQSLSKALNYKDFLDRINGWLENQEFNYQDLIAKVFPIQNDIYNLEEAVNQLILRILSAVGTPPEGYSESNGSDIFNRIYRDYFNNTPKNLNSINSDLLDQKKNYIHSLYLNSLAEVNEKIKTLKKQLNYVNIAFQDINSLIITIRKKIRLYRQKLITEIEIPFYIYSGKILQTHQAGLGYGVFIKDPAIKDPTSEDELKNIRLVSNWESDHDILNTMSSGQISAVVISLTLALHRVYSTKFSTILIDDPVQTMDDVNMSSLVEVLRNDFCKKQIILSTHENKVARYFSYKFLKYNKSVKSVNLMERAEYILNSNYVYKAKNS